MVQAELVKAIQERAGSYEIQQVMELLNLLLEESRNNLVTAAQERILHNQAEAQTLTALIRLLMRPNITPNQ